jgi:hypothetical protein
MALLRFRHQGFQVLFRRRLEVIFFQQRRVFRRGAEFLQPSSRALFTSLLPFLTPKPFSTG